VPDFDCQAGDDPGLQKEGDEIDLYGRWLLADNIPSIEENALQCH